MPVTMSRIQHKSTPTTILISHFSNFLTEAEKGTFSPFPEKYKIALERARFVGGKDLKDKRYSEVIAFNHDNMDILGVEIAEYMSKLNLLNR